MDVFGVRPPMDQDFARRPAHEDVRAAMQEVARTNLAPGDRGYHLVVLVDDIDQLQSGVHDRKATPRSLRLRLRGDF